MEAKDGPISAEGGGGGAVTGVAITAGSAPTASPGTNGGGEVKRGINMSKLAALRAKKRGRSVLRPLLLSVPYLLARPLGIGVAMCCVHTRTEVVPSCLLITHSILNTPLPLHCHSTRTAHPRTTSPPSWQRAAGVSARATAQHGPRRSERR